MIAKDFARNWRVVLMPTHGQAGELGYTMDWLYRMLTISQGSAGLALLLEMHSLPDEW